MLKRVAAVSLRSPLRYRFVSVFGNGSAATTTVCTAVPFLLGGRGASLTSSCASSTHSRLALVTLRSFSEVVDEISKFKESIAEKQDVTLVNNTLEAALRSSSHKDQFAKEVLNLGIPTNTNTYELLLRAFPPNYETEVIKVMTEMRTKGIPFSAEIYTSMMDFWGRKGDLDKVEKLYIRALDDGSLKTRSSNTPTIIFVTRLRWHMQLMVPTEANTQTLINVIEDMGNQGAPRVLSMLIQPIVQIGVEERNIELALRAAVWMHFFGLRFTSYDTFHGLVQFITEQPITTQLTIFEVSKVIKESGYFYKVPREERRQFLEKFEARLEAIKKACEQSD